MPAASAAGSAPPDRPRGCRAGRPAGPARARPAARAAIASPSMKSGTMRDPEPGLGRAHQRLAVVDRQPPADPHLALLARRPAQPPEVAGGEVRIVQQAVGVQVVDAARRPAPGQIGRRGDHHAARLGELPRRSELSAKRADADGDVVALGDELDEAVLEHHLDVDLGVGGRGSPRPPAPPARPRRRPAPRPCSVPFGVACIAVTMLSASPACCEHGPRPVVVGEPDLGRADPPRGAGQEPHGQPRLERRDMLGHRRLREAELARRLGEAAVVDDLNEGLHLGQPVHRRPTIVAERER